MEKTDDIKLAVGPDEFVKTTFKKMNIDELHFYPDNPRISSITLQYNNTDLNDDLIYKLMETEQSEATKQLYQDIKSQGLINEPIIVHQNKVLEGNTRLWVAKTLYKDTRNEYWKNIPCRVIEGTLSNKQIDFILCNAHIKKKRDWIPFEQACYFYRMNSEENRTIKEISEMTGVIQQKIIDYIKTFKEMKARNSDKDNFSHYYETIRQSEVRKAEKNGIPVLNIMEKAIKSGDVIDAKHVRKLKNILKDPVATTYLVDSGDIYNAEKIAITRNPEQDDDFLKALVDIQTMIQNVQYDKITSIKQNPRKLKIVKDFLDSISKFSDLLNK